MVLPVPGGPVISMWWPPAAATTSARFACVWPRTSDSEVVAGGATGGRGDGSGSGRFGVSSRPHHVEKGRDRVVADIAERGQFQAMAGGRDQPGVGAGELGGGAEGAPDRADVAVEREFAEELETVQVLTPHLFGGGEDGNGDGQVETPPVLGEIGGRKVDHESPLGVLEPGVSDGASDPVAGFPNRRLRHAHEGEGGGSSLEMRLHEDPRSVDADLGAGSDGD